MDLEIVMLKGFFLVERAKEYTERRHYLGDMSPASIANILEDLESS